MIKVVVKKYGRWNELSNWQLESRKEKMMEESAFREFVDFAGYKHNKQYNEYTAVSEDKHRMTVVCATEV